MRKLGFKKLATGLMALGSLAYGSTSMTSMAAETVILKSTQKGVSEKDADAELKKDAEKNAKMIYQDLLDENPDLNKTNRKVRKIIYDLIDSAVTGQYEKIGTLGKKNKMTYQVSCDDDMCEKTKQIYTKLISKSADLINSSEEFPSLAKNTFKLVSEECYSDVEKAYNESQRKMNNRIVQDSQINELEVKGKEFLDTMKAELIDLYTK